MEEEGKEDFTKWTSLQLNSKPERHDPVHCHATVAPMHIGNAVFYCSEFTTLDLLTSVMHIGDGAFRNSRPTSLHLPASVTHIGDRAFRKSKLTSLQLPASVTHIGNTRRVYH